MREFLTVRIADGMIEGAALMASPDDGPIVPQQPLFDGVMLVEYTGFTRAGRRDSEAAYWRDGGVEWVEGLSLEQIRDQKNAEINATRESINSTSFTFKGKAIRCRPLDRSDIDGTNGYIALFGTFPDGWAGGWKCADNTYVPIANLEDWKAFYKSMVDTGNANFLYAQQLKNRLALAATHEEIAAIKWGMPIV